MTTRLQDLLPLVQRIQADPGNDASLAALAEQVQLSPTHLQRVFTACVGESPKRVATRVSLERAAARLLATSDSVLQIALASGFESHEGFSRAFRRHFSMSPTRYRSRARPDAATATTHRQIVARVAPCVRLFGARLQPTTQGRALMSYTITKKNLNAAPILYMRRRVRHADVASALGELLPRVYAFAMQKGIPFAGPPVCRYAEWSAGGVTLEAGMPVATTEAEGDGEVLVGALPAGPVAATVHTGPYDQLHNAHAAIEAWFERNALRSAGAPWEVYLTDPGEVPNPAEWQTEVICPLHEASAAN